jgi:hypothetical protein
MANKITKTQYYYHRNEAGNRDGLITGSIFNGI